MKLRESLRISWRAITGHKLRSTLTTLGIIIGIGAVIAFMVMGSGFEANILGDIESDEDTTMTIRTEVPVEGGTGVQYSQAPIYTETDVTTVSEIDGVEYTVPTARISATQLRYEGHQTTGGFSVSASTPDQFADDIWELVEGESFERGTDEAVINEILVEALGGDIGVGDEFTIRFEDGTETTFTVAGVVDDDTGPAIGPRIHVPIDPHYTTTIETPRGTEERAFAEFVVGVESVDVLDEVQAEARAYFDGNSDAEQLKNDDHTIVVQTVDDVIDQVTDIIDQFALFLGGIAAISLLVGSIGIANIMIVSVTERTREIGIMKAVGARRRDIMQLFLVESLVLGIIGAIGGVLLGLGLGYLGVSLLGWPMAYPLDWMAIAIVVGILVGILSGLYPAWRAAKVDPIEALRRE